MTESYRLQVTRRKVTRSKNQKAKTKKQEPRDKEQEPGNAKEKKSIRGSIIQQKFFEGDPNYNYKPQTENSN